MSRIDDGYEPDDTASFLRSCAFSHNVDQAVKGKKGLKFFKELEAALLALPEKRLSEGRLARARSIFYDWYDHYYDAWDRVGLGYIGPELPRDGEVCALGTVALKRALDRGRKRPEVIHDLDEGMPPDEDVSGWEMIEDAAIHLKISMPLAYAVVERNDSGPHDETEAERYARMLSWVQKRIQKLEHPADAAP